jgi:hypothetical protein
MRAMKRTVSLVLAMMLVLGMATLGIGVASAAETNTITFTSNYGASGSVQYTPGSTEQVTVTYSLTSQVPIVNVEGVLQYSSSVLKVASTNTAATFAPNLSSAQVNLEKSGRIPFNWSNFNAADFSTKKTLVTVVFDVIGSGDTSVYLKLNILTGNTNSSSTLSNTDVDLVNNGAVVDSSKFTADVAGETKEEGVDSSVFVSDVRLALEGKIGVNIYLNEAPAGFDASKITIEFAGPNEEMNKTVALNDLQRVKRSGKYVRYAQYYVYSSWMTEPITMNFYNDGTKVATYSITVEEWVANNVGNYTTTNPNVATLMKTMLNYGAASQAYFDYKTDDLANKNNDLALQQITADTIQTPESGMGGTPNLTSIGATWTKCSAELKEGNALRLQVKVNNADTFSAKNTVSSSDGTSFPLVIGSSGKNAQGVQENIVAADLDKVYTFTFANHATYKQSVMNYMKTVLASNAGNDKVVNLASSMYWYNQAANAVFG